MSSAKMTPGPWMADDTRVICSLDDCVDAWVATVCTPVDARAIACLPELVEAARNALWHLGDHTEGRATLRTDELVPTLRRILARIDGMEGE